MVPAAVAVSAHAVVSASDVVPAISMVDAELRCSAERPYPDALCRCGRVGWCRARSIMPGGTNGVQLTVEARRIRPELMIQEIEFAPDKRGGYDSDALPS